MDKSIIKTKKKDLEKPEFEGIFNQFYNIIN